MNADFDDDFNDDVDAEFVAEFIRLGGGRRESRLGGKMAGYQTR